jgi:cyclophilin family peptidyl-prolyl cis-trans isomerase
MAGLSALPVVFLDFTIGDVPAGRVEIQLNTKSVPRTAENFRLLCTGEKGFGFKGSLLHSVIPGFCVKGGDFQKGDGTGGKAVYYGGKFDDENFELKHAGAGTVSMVNDGQVDNNSSIFRISTRRKTTPWLDGKEVVFGTVSASSRDVSMQVLGRIERVGKQSGETSHPVKIVDCGQVS